MKKIAFLTLILFITFIQKSYSMEFEGSMRGLCNLATAFQSDTFYPKTHFQENEIFLSVTPAYYSVEVFCEQESTPGSYGYTVTGDDANVFGVNMAVDYCINRDWMLFTSLTVMKSGGKITNTSSTGSKEFTEGDMTTLYQNIGFGYEFLNSDKWSFPMYLGFAYRKFFVDMTGTNDSPYNTLYRADIDSTDCVYGFFIGFSVARRFVLLDNNFKLVFFMTWDGFDEEIEFDITVTDSSDPLKIGARSKSESCATPHSDFFLSGPLPGLKFTWESQNSISLSISINGFISNTINWYNDYFIEGLKYKYASITVSYRL